MYVYFPLLSGRELIGAKTAFLLRLTPLQSVGGERPAGGSHSSPLKKPIRSAAGSCGRITALRSLSESPDSTRSRALSSVTMARPRLQSNFINGLLGWQLATFGRPNPVPVSLSSQQEFTKVSLTSDPGEIRNGYHQ